MSCFGTKIVYSIQMYSNRKKKFNSNNGTPNYFGLKKNILKPGWISKTYFCLKRRNWKELSFWASFSLENIFFLDIDFQFDVGIGKL